MLPFFWRKADLKKLEKSNSTEGFEPDEYSFKTEKNPLFLFFYSPQRPELNY